MWMTPQHQNPRCRTSIHRKINFIEEDTRITEEQVRLDCAAIIEEDGSLYTDTKALVTLTTHMMTGWINDSQDHLQRDNTTGGLSTCNSPSAVKTKVTSWMRGQLI